MAVLTKLSVPTAGGERGTLMPKLQYRFRVIFDYDTKQFITSNVVSSTKPSMSHEPVTLDVYNSKINLAGKHTWEPVNIVMRDDVTNTVMKQIDEQMQRQINQANQSSPLAGASYKFTVTIETLDGGNTKPFVIDRWTLSGAYIENVQHGEQNYSSSEANQITVTLRYDNATNERFNPSGKTGATL